MGDRRARSAGRRVDVLGHQVGHTVLDMTSLAEKVAEWLRKGGYPLEMRTASTLRQHSALSVVQSDYFRDPITGKHREIDIVASRDGAFDTMANVRAEAIIECKRTDDKPWVAFHADRTLEPPHSIRERMASEAGARWLELGTFRESFAQQQVFSVDAPAYAVVTALGDQESGGNAYAACSSVYAAATARLAALEDDQRRVPVAVAFPVVVVSGQMFSARLAEGDDIQLTPVEHVQVLWRQAEAPRTLSLIDIVTEDAFPVFAEMLATSFEALVAGNIDLARQAIEETGPAAHVF